MLGHLVWVVSPYNVELSQLYSAEPELNFLDVAPVFFDVIVADVPVGAH